MNCEKAEVACVMIKVISSARKRKSQKAPEYDYLHRRIS
jgi:hypothetical protein